MEFSVLCVLTALILWSCISADRRISALERKVDSLLHHFGITPAYPAAPGEPSDKVREVAARTRNRIAVMRAYRTETGADVPTAKAVADKLIAEANSL